MPTYPITPEMQEILDNNFIYHAPFGDQADRYALIRAEARTLAELIARNVPPSREQALALTALEDVMFFSNAAIARHETP